MTTYPSGTSTIQDHSFTSGSGQLQHQGWSTFMNDYNVGGDDGYPPSGTPPNIRTYAWNVYFNNYGKQKFYASADDEGVVKINGAWQFATGDWTGQFSRTTPGYFAPGVYTVSVTVTNSGFGFKFSILWSK